MITIVGGGLSGLATALAIEDLAKKEASLRRDCESSRPRDAREARSKATAATVSSASGDPTVGSTRNPPRSSSATASVCSARSYRPLTLSKTATSFVAGGYARCR